MTDIEAAITQLADIGQAIADAEAEVAAAERKVAALRAIRDDLQPFIARYQSVLSAMAYARRLGLLRMERRGRFTAAETASPNQEERPPNEL